MAKQPPILLINASFEVLNYIKFRRAIQLILDDKARVFEAIPDKFVHSAGPADGPGLKIPWPASIVLNNYVLVPMINRSFGDDVLAAKAAVLRRDGYCCAYCGSSASTVDHVHPKSRGGEDTWLNLVAACLHCNQYKKDRTPEEADMQLLWQPFVPSDEKNLIQEQKKVYRLLNTGAISLDDEDEYNDEQEDVD